MQTIIEARNMTKVYGKKGSSKHTALNGLSFSMEEGEFIGIMGPSGSGKTTLLNIISTIDTVTNGQITIAGKDLSAMSQDELSDFRSQKLGFIFQDFNLLETMTVFENIALPLALQHAQDHIIVSKVQEVASILGIDRILNNYPSEISGGQKQRAAIARALVHNPTVILGDEPTGSLDSKNATNLLTALANLNQEHGVSIMMVTHDANSASYCNRVLFIQDGKIHKELLRNSTRKQFYQEILQVLSEIDTELS
ncbi:bacitracin ABC transporter ATP-binding protein [Bacillus sp. SA1-12]|uniref:ABC transporter ATP-binding protein n=1 Tax=Bacillus sp. SA1-12 TaxID=1455638 RepID=UPI0006271976|nr:ABC transporter ATP-binding protein [Bacillus sp. SA1-12]KKI90035.1 bacitracin ABC transporter ATP-binding protein [Bacillus sp. SA1-12]